MSQTHCQSRPASILATNAPWKLNPAIARHVRCTAAGLVGKAGLTPQDREDLEQELTAHLLSRISQFNPSRSGLDTFVTRLLDNAAASLISTRKREKRDWRRTVCSLDEEIENDEGDLQPLMELLDLEHGPENGLQAHETQREQMALRIDVQRVMATLSEKERQVCQLLMRYDACQTAQRAKISRSTLYHLLRKLRAAFEAAGLKIYL